MSDGAHDDLDIDEILRRLEAAERLVREAREMLGARAAGSRAEADHGPLFEAPAATAATGPAPAPAPPVAAGPVSDLDPALLERHAPPGPGEPYQGAITALFRLATDDAARGDAAAELLARLMHSEAIAGERALESLLAFPWRRFVKQHAAYLADPEDPATFSVAHTRPRDPGDTDQLKAYLQAPRRSPVPVELARDRAAGGAWRVVAFSL